LLLCPPGGFLSRVFCLGWYISIPSRTSRMMMRGAKSLAFAFLLYRFVCVCVCVCVRVWDVGGLLPYPCMKEKRLIPNAARKFHIPIMNTPHDIAIPS